MLVSRKPTAPTSSSSTSSERGRRPAGADARADRARHAVQHGQAPAEHPSERLAQEHEHAEDQHAEPEMALVIEREIAVAGVAVGRQVEQQQPADAGQRARGRDSRRATPSSAGPAGSRLRSQPDSDEHDDGAREQPQHERRRHREPPRAVAPGLERAIGGERPRNAAEPRGDRPDGERQRDAERRRHGSAGEVHQAEAGQHPAGPLPARRVQQRRASPRSWRGLPGAWRASAISTDVCASASGRRTAPHRPLPGSGFDRQQRDVGQRRRRGMPVDRRGKQQQRIRARHVVVGRRARRSPGARASPRPSRRRIPRASAPRRPARRAHTD